MLADARQTVALRAGRFHASLAQALADIAAKVCAEHGEFAVGLGGGVFQNELLADAALKALGDAGLRAYLPSRIPCNDGGLSFGQLVEAQALLSRAQQPDRRP